MFEIGLLTVRHCSYVANVDDLLRIRRLPYRWSTRYSRCQHATMKNRSTRKHEISAKTAHIHLSTVVAICELDTKFLQYCPSPTCGEVNVYIMAKKIRLKFLDQDHQNQMFLSMRHPSLNNNKLCGRPPQYAPPPASWPFDLESGVRVTCDVVYLCANFSFPRPLCSRLRPDVRDKQTSDAHHRLMPLP